MSSIANEHKSTVLMVPLALLTDLKQVPLCTDGPFHVYQVVKHRIPARDPAPEFVYRSALRPVHGLGGIWPFGIYQNDIEHVLLDGIRDHVPAWAHPKVDTGAFRQVPGRVTQGYGLGWDGDAVDHVARAIRRVLTAQQASPATRPLPIGAEYEVRFVDLSSGETEGWFAEVNFCNLAAKFDLYGSMLARPR